MTTPALTVFVCGAPDDPSFEAFGAATFDADEPDACPHCGAEGEREDDYAHLCSGCGRQLYEENVP